MIGFTLDVIFITMTLTYEIRIDDPLLIYELQRCFFIGPAFRIITDFLIAPEILPRHFGGLW